MFEILGKLLIKQRNRLKISQTELATLVNLSQSYIAKMESGKLLPTPEKMICLLDAYNIQYDDLIDILINYSYFLDYASAINFESLYWLSKSSRLIFNEFSKQVHIYNKNNLLLNLDENYINKEIESFGHGLFLFLVKLSTNFNPDLVSTNLYKFCYALKALHSDFSFIALCPFDYSCCDFRLISPEAELEEARAIKVMGFMEQVELCKCEQIESEMDRLQCPMSSLAEVDPDICVNALALNKNIMPETFYNSHISTGVNICARKSYFVLFFSEISDLDLKNKFQTYKDPLFALLGKVLDNIYCNQDTDAYRYLNDTMLFLEHSMNKKQ